MRIGDRGIRERNEDQRRERQQAEKNRKGKSDSEEAGWFRLCRASLFGKKRSVRIGKTEEKIKSDNLLFPNGASSI